MSDPASARRGSGAAGALGRAPEPVSAPAPAVPGPALTSAAGAVAVPPAAAPPVLPPIRLAPDPAAAFTGDAHTATRRALATTAAARPQQWADQALQHPEDGTGRVPRPVIGAAALFGVALAAVPFVLAATQHEHRDRPPAPAPAASFEQQVSPPGVVPSIEPQSGGAP